LESPSHRVWRVDRYRPRSLRFIDERCSETTAEQTRNNPYRNIERQYSMPLLQVVLVLVVVGVLLWLVDRYVPMASSIKSILNAVVTIAVVLWLLNVFGLMHYLTNIRIGKS